jgi:hypothetical protein
MSSVLLKTESGSLNAYCTKCGTRLEKTTADLKELVQSGKFICLDIICSGCASKLKINIQLGNGETGAL